jgi:hypothetical protein
VTSFEAIAPDSVRRSALLKAQTILAWGSPVKISFRETGGFVPVARACDLDSEKMNPAEAAELAALVKASGILNMRDSRVPGAADVVRFSFEIEQDEIRHAVKFDNPSLPKELAPLVAFLRDRSQPLL